MKDLHDSEARAVNAIKANPRYFYSFAKKYGKTKSSVSPLRDKDGKLTDDPLKKANILQSQYSQVFSDPDAVDIDECLSTLKPDIQANESMDNIAFTEEDIISAIGELDPYSAAPENDIPARILCSCSAQLAKPLFLMWKDTTITQGPNNSPSSQGWQQDKPCKLPSHIYHLSSYQNI